MIGADTDGAVDEVDEAVDITGKTTAASDKTTSARSLAGGSTKRPYKEETKRYEDNALS